jgi:hypothetical protein
VAVNDDIVTRLRKALQYEDGYQMTIAPEVVSAIADEIERLRRWKNWGLHISVCPNWKIRTCWDCVVPDLQDEAEQQGTAALIKRETKRYGS